MLRCRSWRQDQTATAATNMTAHMECYCTHCGAGVEAIFQPIGRDVCKTFNIDLPCATEEAACAAANSDAALYTGTLADGDLAYTPVNSGSSTSVCQPEKAKFACECPLRCEHAALSQSTWAADRSSAACS